MFVPLLSMSGSSENNAACKRFCRKCKAHSFCVAAHTLCPFSSCNCATCEKISQNNEVARERTRKRRAEQAAVSSCSSTAVTVEQVLTLAKHNSGQEQDRKKMSKTSLNAEKLNQRRKEMSEYDKFMNDYMSSLSEGGKVRSPLANMALASKAWKEKQQKPISQRLLKSSAKQDEELDFLGLSSYCKVDHINLGLPSSLGTGHENASVLANLFPQLPPPHLEKHLTSANGELEEAVDAILLETRTQNVSSGNPAVVGTPIVKDPTSSYEDSLAQMFPQYQQEGISCALKSCQNNFYDTVDLLLKLLPEENRKRDSPAPEIISFSQTASSAVNHIPKAPLNPHAMALSSPSTPSGTRKTHFCKRCGHLLPVSFTGGLCPNPSCEYPLQQNLRM